MRSVAEERGKEITLNPTRVDLYDVIIEKRPITSTGVSPVMRPDRSSKTISIKEMLKGVKDYLSHPSRDAWIEISDVIMKKVHCRERSFTLSAAKWAFYWQYKRNAAKCQVVFIEGV